MSPFFYMIKSRGNSSIFSLHFVCCFLLMDKINTFFMIFSFIIVLMLSRLINKRKIIKIIMTKRIHLFFLYKFYYYFRCFNLFLCMKSYISLFLNKSWFTTVFPNQTFSTNLCIRGSKPIIRPWCDSIPALCFNLEVSCLEVSNCFFSFQKMPGLLPLMVGPGSDRARCCQRL